MMAEFGGKCMRLLIKFHLWGGHWAEWNAIFHISLFQKNILKAEVMTKKSIMKAHLCCCFWSSRTTSTRPQCFTIVQAAPELGITLTLTTHKIRLRNMILRSVHSRDEQKQSPGIHQALKRLMNDTQGRVKLESISALIWEASSVLTSWLEILNSVHWGVVIVMYRTQK